ncbi:hypothetical protein NQ314_000857 [Rhamnusium bicolor]|uniref:Adenylate cyclase conserved domain-containing protein n=1 Tax=Rhamnusium bicolor TaxID=1586634 RepID=A0AAV8ZTL2_9CUCU|nr:hypothetical protein NQ314_000857 [Rhamnusium bicolor]
MGEESQHANKSVQNNFDDISVFNMLTDTSVPYQNHPMNGNVAKEMRIMGHGSQHGHSSKLGFNESTEREKNPEDEVNEYLMKAIDARSIDRLRTEHCRTLLLNFRDPLKEAKYVLERDRMLTLYFFCSTFCFVTIILVQIAIFRRNDTAVLCSVPIVSLLIFIPILVYMENINKQLSLPYEIQCLNSVFIDGYNCTSYLNISLNNDNENKDCKPYYLVDVISFTPRFGFDDCVRRISNPYLASEDNHLAGWNGGLPGCLRNLLQRNAHYSMFEQNQVSTDISIFMNYGF